MMRLALDMEDPYELHQYHQKLQKVSKKAIYARTSPEILPMHCLYSLRDSRGASVAWKVPILRYLLIAQDNFSDG